MAKKLVVTNLIIKKYKMEYINFTTPIFYTNGQPHIGHYYTTILADTFKRFYNLFPDTNAIFCTGTDEHGLKIQRAAAQLKVSPQSLVDTYAKSFQDNWDRLGIKYDGFIRTTESRHKKIAKRFWGNLFEKGDIYLGTYKGLYCVDCEQYYKESDLNHGKCPIHNTDCEYFEEESYFFRLSKYKSSLLNFFKSEKGKAFIKPNNRINEITSVLENNELNDISISRTSFDWGIKVPNDENHVMYVWFEALINYISILGGPESEKFKKYWKNTYHILGKDIIRFHSIYWIALLIALNLPLPKGLLIHGWWKNSDSKISKSSGKTVSPIDLANIIENDGLRYYILKRGGLKNDNIFNDKEILETLNADLANSIGNLFNRVILLAEKKLESKIPNGVIDEKIKDRTIEFANIFIKSMKNFQQDLAIKELVAFSDYLNKYIHDKAPWTQLKNDISAGINTLSNISEALRWLTNFGSIVFPDIANKMNSILFQEASFKIPTEFKLRTFNVKAFKDNKDNILYQKKYL